MSGGPCGSDEGNLQVGWWKKNEKNTNLLSIFTKLQIDKVGNEKNDPVENERNDDSDEYETVQPVFMDIWRQEYVQTNGKNENENEIVDEYNLKKKISMYWHPAFRLVVATPHR